MLWTGIAHLQSRLDKALCQQAAAHPSGLFVNLQALGEQVSGGVSIKMVLANHRGIHQVATQGAEREGFEPSTREYRALAFQASSLSLSDTSPATI